jgi:hypothetical protein
MQQAGDTPPRALDQAIASWQQRGYRVAYHDDYLVQLFRREMPDGVLAVTALAALVALGVIIVFRLKKRPWHIVLLTTTGDDRVIPHHQRSWRLPPQ